MRRNRRLRKGFFLLGCLIALAVLGGCGTAAPPETAEAAPAASPEASPGCVRLSIRRLCRRS